MGLIILAFFGGILFAMAVTVTAQYVGAQMADRE